MTALEEQLSLELRNKLIHLLGEIVEGRPSNPQGGICALFQNTSLPYLSISAGLSKIGYPQNLGGKALSLLYAAFGTWQQSSGSPVPPIGITYHEAYYAGALYTTDTHSKYYPCAELRRELAAHTAKYLGEHWD